MAAWSRVPARSSCTDCGSWRWGPGRVGHQGCPFLSLVWVFGGAVALPLSPLCQAAAEMNIS